MENTIDHPEPDNIGAISTPPLEVNRKPKRAPRNHQTPPSLRPPTLMIDLLFGALMLFAFQMGDPNARTVVPKDFDLPTSNENADRKGQVLFSLKPVKVGQSVWVYQLPSGQNMSASEVVNYVRTEKKTPVLLVPSTSNIQDYIDAEQPLRHLGIKPGLAVDVNEGVRK